jgi:hypothetical protein
MGKTSSILLGTIIGIGTMIMAEIAVAQTPTTTTAPVKSNGATTKPATPKTTQEALEAVQKSGEFLVVVFYDQKDELLATVDQTITKFQKSSSERIRVFHAAVKDKAEAQTITKYRIDRAKLPLVLVFASNGAITGGFEQKVTEQQLQKSLVPELVAKVIKAVHEQKVAVVSLQNLKTKFNAESSKVADEFAGDPKLKGHVEIIQGDPSDSKNQEFLAQCEIKPPVESATLVLLAPPSGTIMGIFTGEGVTKDILIEALTPPSSGCCPGGSGSCK